MFLRPAFGLDWSDLAEVAVPGGLVVFPTADGSMGVAIVFAGAGPDSKPLSLLTAAGRYFAQKGFRAKEVRRASGQLTVFEPPAAEKSKAPRVSFVAEGFCGIANSHAAVDTILNVNRERSLATEPTLKNSLATLAAGEPVRGSDATFFIRPLELWELARRSDATRAARCR